MRSDIYRMRESIVSTLEYFLTQQGRTLHQIDRNAQTDISEHDKPVWHTPKGLMEKVANHLRLDSSIWDKDRDTDDFCRLIQNEIIKHRRQGHIIYAKRAFRCILPVQNEPAKPAINEVNQMRHTMSEMFQAILHPSNGSKDNTYKFALARAILDHCQSSASLNVSYEYLAERFLKYYWHQICKYHIRQDFHTIKKAAVVTIIQNIFKEPPGSFDLCRKEDVTRAIDLIQKRVFGHARQKTSIVVHKFQNIRVGRHVVEQRSFYEPDDNMQMIRLTPQAHDFFRLNGHILYKSVFFEWAKFLERVNGSLPMLLSKVEQDNIKRRGLVLYRNKYLQYTDECFYCKNMLKGGHTEVDHLIPWSYIFEDEAWNLVLACHECNHKKSNSLPQEEFLSDLVKRNEKEQHNITILYRSLRRLGRDKDWQEEINNHYKNCMSYGFLPIKLP
ncbi:MAG: hypothetical protein F4W68_04115 [Cenarchaeum sp. SB0661_bin_35]|nr:hypothetical protein [Cenarchaeum sp. SB0666_bin_15]MYB46735.1 hypothetical protein [Cenarchaeum sp. SB0662_bin_33]MYC79668.1 hypothetical protein [Cenarchaeum sp. SB0661_bin_35]MYD58917.1 hypothetical protein [Cenarchaeum sp. SB0678_bin_8]